ncbi:O-antigen ligase family protein [Crocinitomicaceae bacterium CZZ-1]|uniref:O-antigen ligase family protein n=1 Tax=Taishania pollutisoli TaxID=2766479 RepID=A0A8J6P540_9FLAO|nr:O-antigen ligase family protein [Taishania pollutisoli]MBC9811957.1 O-antigen ligase family protein [Taishania pollutisoli]
MLNILTKENNRFFIHQPRGKQPGALDSILLLLLLTSILFFPFIPLSSSFFFSLEEVVVVLIGARLLQKQFFWLDRYLFVIIAFAVYATVVIVINPNRTHLSEYFEVYKILKYGTIYVFAIYYFLEERNHGAINKYLLVSFLILFFFNVMHYFNIIDFNKNITILYDSDGRDVRSFGLNSIGQAGPKRIVGTMGNPNDNAILFLFYFVYFQYLSVTVHSNKNMLYRCCYYGAFLMIILCQSRTGIVATFVVFFAGFFMRSKTMESIKSYLIHLFVFVLLIALLFSFEKEAGGMQYLRNTNVLNVGDNNSVRGRFEIWSYLIDMWMNKPVFGYGPNKEFMYSNFIYPENEYIFYLWRYGIIGLIFYLLILFIPAALLLRAKPINKFIIPFLLMLLTIALANNPFSNPKFLIIIALIIGYCVSLYYKKQQKADE